ncbi:peroxidase [Leisingera daeponensis]|uniref:Peroxidase n=1 Tax=Leisingera daeponensis TaxID=405746 RepID=A0ABS7NI15_9RHOB|nr:peroxidase family protein [Leisingera daeponensis]MBY6140853.1 peroxidase [Leisingera daeponensis]
MSNLEIGAARPADGTSANPDHPDWGATNTALMLMAPSGLGPNGEMAGGDRPNPREISNILSQQHGSTQTAGGASDFLWIWGQFLDHDLSLSGAESEITAHIKVPAGDPFFDPFGTGQAIIPFTRVEHHHDGYHNEITAYIDASMIYGSTEEMLNAIRGAGGKLKMTEDDLLLRDGDGFLTGDVRAAENVALTSMHTLFTREHNRLVDELAARDPMLTDDQLFEAARARVEALVQAVTFKEFLPILIGEDAFGAYQGYNPTVNPGIAIEFSTAVYRLGHTLLSANLKRVTESGDQLDPLALRDAFFQPHLISQKNMIENVLRGAATQTSEAVDTKVVEDVRSFLFGPPGAGGLDLAALNIQRGRDMGVASYNELREALGLSPAEKFSDITSDAALAAKLEEAYGDTDLVDAWIGGLAEDPHGDGLLGETFTIVMIDQFTRLRDGDPYWSEEREGIPDKELTELWDTKLSEIIVRNTDVSLLQKDVFVAMDRTIGTNGSDDLTGSNARDFIHGRKGADYLEGRAGNDDLRGGNGWDTLVGNRGDDCLAGGQGRDLLSGGSGDDFIFGGAHNDRLNGGTGHDELLGGNGNDQLRGKGGNDILDGGGHNDLLIGGMGDDLLTGGAGADLFVFRSSHTGGDTITDFELGVDLIKAYGATRHSLQITDYGDYIEVSDGGNWSVALEGLTLRDWHDSGFNLF